MNSSLYWIASEPNLLHILYVIFYVHTLGNWVDLNLSSTIFTGSIQMAMEIQNKETAQIEEQKTVPGKKEKRVRK